ncbi:hypothetical protein AM587_10005409 [Phytophthora nicotianae]|nr:hypothetical protein AM587_10005409 [Phytophthora nicotianae]
MILHDRGVCSGFKYGEVALFSASMSVMMYCYEHEKESMSPFLYSTMKRFMQTSTDKKQQYVASLEQKERRLSSYLSKLESFHWSVDGASTSTFPFGSWQPFGDISEIHLG